MPDTIERSDPATLEAAIEVCRNAGILCVDPRLSPTDRAEEAVQQLAIELRFLESALRCGGELSEQKRRNVGAIARRLLAVAGQS